MLTGMPHETANNNLLGLLSVNFCLVGLLSVGFCLVDLLSVGLVSGGLFPLVFCRTPEIGFQLYAFCVVAAKVV